MRVAVILATFCVLLCGLASATEKPVDVAMAPAFADRLRPDPRAAGSALDGLALEHGAIKWWSNAGVTLGADGATTSASGSGAHHVIPSIAGVIRVCAEVHAEGSGFTAIALGRGDLSRNFWANNELYFFVNGSSYGVLVGKQNLVARPDAKLLSADGVNQLELQVDTVARTVSARLNGRSVLKDAVLPAATRVEAINAAGFRFNEPVVAGKPFVRDWQIELQGKANAGLIPVDYAMYFVDPGQVATLRWTCVVRGATDQAPYTISDYTGKQIDEGSATVAADGSVSLSRSFPRGYYEIAFKDAQQTFGVVSLEPHQALHDPFFGIDAALSWLETDAARRDGLVRILARSGISIARERMGLGAVNPVIGKYEWDKSPRTFDTVRGIYRKQNVALLEMLYGKSPQHGAIAGSPFGQNLAELASSWVAVTKHWQPAWGAAEVENEPDLQSVPADEYAPCVKTVSHALRQAGAAVPVVGGVFATIPPGAYFDACAANGMLADSDVVSFHSYDRAPAVEGMVARYRAWLAKSGAETLPLWHSECGWPWVNGPARPPLAQDAVSAAEIAMKAVESRVCGVARYFPFVYVYYEEGPKNFGMMGREVSPLRSMAAYVMTAQALSGRQYLGDLQGVGAPVTLARVFGTPDNRGNEDYLAALYSGDATPGAVVHLPIPILRAAGADGRNLPIVDGNVSLADGMAFVWLDAKVCAANMKTDTPAARLYALGRKPLVRERLASDIVLQFNAPKTPARVSARRYLIAQESAHTLPIHVFIHNLSAAPIDVVPNLTLPGGAPMAAKKVQAPAMGSVEVSWTVEATAALDIAQTRMITISATVEGARVQPSNLAIPLLMDGTLEQHLAKHTRQRPLPITELDRWKPNNSANGVVHFSAPDSLWRMDEKFTTKGGNWDYPKFTLPKPINPATETGFLVRARIMKPASNVAIIANVYQPDSFWAPDIFPADGQWHVVYVPFAEFKPGPNGAGMQNSRLDPASWKVLAIGMGSLGEENALEVSHLIVVGGGE